MTQNFFRKEVLDLAGYPLVKGEEGVKLDQNESPFDLPAELKQKVLQILANAEWNRYPLNEPILLKEKMGAYLKVSPDQLLFANGSNVLIQALVVATSINQKVLVVDPTFSLYELEAKLFGNQVIRVPLNADFSFPLDLFIQKIRDEKPSLIFLANPNAPTGNLISQHDIQKILEAASCLVVIDEAYFPFVPQTSLPLLSEFKNLVVLRTFSKAFSLAGGRLGFLVASADVCRQVEKCLLPFCINKMTYALAFALLENIFLEKNLLEKTVEVLTAERDWLYNKMKTISGLTIYPSQTNFLLFQVADGNHVYQQLKSQKVIIRNVSNGRSLTNALRVSVGSREENEKFLLELQKIL